MIKVTAGQSIYEVEEGTTLEQLAKQLQKKEEPVILLAYMDGKLTELFTEIKKDCHVRFVTLKEQAGYMAYKRTATFIFLKACEDLLGKGESTKIAIDYSIGNSIFCDFSSMERIVDDKFAHSIQKRMEQLYESDLPITKRSLDTDQASRYFDSVGLKGKRELFKFRRESKTNIYSMDGYDNYFYGYMAPSTGMLGVFDLFLYDEGFVLQLPVKEAPEIVPEFAPQQKLFQVLKESTQWANMLGIDTVGALNEHITNNDMNSLILVQEALQEQKIVEIVNSIKKRKSTKFVMIAGPSSSGKTTFANRLSIQLRANGYKPHPISVDNYFVEREQTPLDEDGNYNFEDLHAIDIELFNRHMEQLLEGKRVCMPTFNFKTGKKEYGNDYLQLGAEDILVIEGIHCLNDEMSYMLPKESKYKIYISALTQLNVDEHNRVATTDGRLIRRLVRDSRTRGASAARTLGMWESVRKGEEKNIFPFQEHADAMFNSAMPYELSVLKPYVEPLLFSVGEDEPEYQEAKRLLKFLAYFLPYTSENIPINSIVREFVGGGCFKV